MRTKPVEVWIDGIRFESLTDIYIELAASSAKAQAEVRRCVKLGIPFKKHVLLLSPPERKRKAKPASDMLLPGLTTHRLGYNPGRF